MNNGLFLLCFSFFILLVSCSHDYVNTKVLQAEFDKRSGQKIDTLIVSHHECTECLDLYIEQGTLTVPDDIKVQLAMIPEKDIKVCGNFPMDLLDVTAWGTDPGLEFKITGKVIRADKHNSIGSVPLFYVSSWEKYPAGK